MDVLNKFPHKSVDVMNKFPRNSRSKDRSAQMHRLSFRKSSESSRSLDYCDVDTEGRRKAAAWAWHQRSGGDAVPTRRVVDSTIAVSRQSMEDRPKSRFEAQAARETALDSSSESKVDPGISLFDASEISSLAKQIASFTERRQEESPSYRGAVAEADGCYMSTDSLKDGVLKPKKSRFRKPFSHIQRLFRKISSANCYVPHSNAITLVPKHHRYYHHHHIYHHHSPDEWSETAQGRPSRRHSANFTNYQERGLADQGTNQMKRHSADYGAPYRARVGNGAGVAQDSLYYYPPKGTTRANSKLAASPRRHSERFSADKAHELASHEMTRIRRQSSADIVVPRRILQMEMNQPEVQRLLDWNEMADL